MNCLTASLYFGLARVTFLSLSPTTAADHSKCSFDVGRNYYASYIHCPAEFVEDCTRQMLLNEFTKIVRNDSLDFLWVHHLHEMIGPSLPS